MNIRKIMKIMSIELAENWSAIIWLDLFYKIAFARIWIITKDVGGDISDNPMLVMYMFGMSILIIFEAVKYKNNKADEEVEQIISILPIIKEELILGRLINSGFIVYMLVIPYITMYIYTPSVIQNIGVRGGLTLLSLYLVVWSTIRTISKYNKKYNILSRILGGMFIVLFLINGFISIVGSWDDALKSLYTREIFTVIGNTLVGIILGILTLICFFYFNFTYVLKGIKNNKWQIR